MAYSVIHLPPQQLSWKAKNKEWRKKHLDWADSKTYFNYNPVRKTVNHKKINYDLLNGVLHMDDIALILNPESLNAGFIPEKIQHYPIINSKLNVLKGEESKRVFDFRVVITNPNSISEIEQNKKKAIMSWLQQWSQQVDQNDQDAQKELEEKSRYFTYEWQDMREIRANCLINHYMKEYNMPLIFNQGFMDALCVGEEIYQCDIVGGEPTLRRINPMKIRVFKSGYSNYIEDADMIMIEDYWSPGKIIDTFYDSLTDADRKYIENMPDNNGQIPHDSMDTIDERPGFIHMHMVSDVIDGNSLFDMPSAEGGSLLPYDMAGNIKVIQLYWKSRRKIKEVKSYNKETGEEEFEFYTEEYVIDKNAGEEEKIYWINEAWEGTKIGSDIYLNMRPRPVQYNRLSNPSRCHFGIIGSIYNLNESKPFSLVDMMKPYSYLYDVIHDRLNKLLSHSYGTLLRVDLAKIPKGWDMEKWLYYAKSMGIAIEDSFKEGDYGVAVGKMAGALNNNNNGAIPTTDANQITQYIQLLEFIKEEMSEVAGITKQREGQISNRETVGGVERSTMQSTHITEWVFTIHDDLKKRVLECFIETAKIAMKGRSKKFEYILSDNSVKMVEIEGDQFSESDYGLVVDSGTGAQELNQKLDMLAQAALQNQVLSFSTIMKMYSSISLSEKQRLVEADEAALKQQQQQQQQAEMEQQQQQQQAQMEIAQQQQQLQLQMKQMEYEQENLLNKRDNDTKMMIAQLQARVKEEEQNTKILLDSNKPQEEPEDNSMEIANLEEKKRQFDEKIKLEMEKFRHQVEEDRLQRALDREKLNTEAYLKKQQIAKQKSAAKSSSKK